MNTVILIIIVFLLTKYGYFNAKKMKQDVVNITKGDMESWKKVNKEYEKHKKRD